MADFLPPRGTQDLLAKRSDAMLALYEDAHRLAGVFGFRYVETPTFEHTDLFARAAGETSDVVTKEMYTFEDKGGRSLTLRPEITPGIVRAYLDHVHELGAPFRAYFVGTCFRHGRPQAGRLREFRQFDVEVIGDASPGSDVEVIEIADRFLRDQGLRRLTLKVNSIGDPVCRPAYRERLIAHLEPHADELDEDCRVRLRVNPLRVFDCKVDGDKDFVLAAPTVSDHLCEACRTHFAGVRAGLDAAGVVYEVDPRLVRGLDYYTRTAFEFVSGVLASSKQGTVCGGGRYDGLAEVLGGPPTPGTGFGLGLDRVLLAMEGEGLVVPAERSPHVFVVAVSEDVRDTVDDLVRRLRGAGVSAISAFEERPLKAQLRMADRAGAAYAALVGEREVAEGVVTLRRLSDGAQEEVPSRDVAERLARRDERTEQP
ncbi:MAG TPA: histidine--tRNA ligase [Actinomycetota bacterium]|nr:histidine--tRNA ligase [Actinomycetota bacterium]